MDNLWHNQELIIRAKYCRFIICLLYFEKRTVTMDIIPAIDIRNGKCVRLYQGDYSRETIFSEDPASVAMKWQSLGAKRIHVIDLDGAASGKPVNLKIVSSIIKQIKIPVQLGGGIRNEADIKALLEIGINRIILGTAAIEKSQLIKNLCQRYDEAIMISIDARAGYVATHGWHKESNIKAIDLAKQMSDNGVRRIIYTDIKRDGTLTEPSYEAISEIINMVKIPVIAAGGISRLSHLKRLAEIGAEGAIVGRALYTGNIDLKQAINLQQNK